LAIAQVPPSSNRLAFVFGSALAEAAEPLRAAILERLPIDSSLRHAPSLDAEARVAFADRRHRVAGNFEPVLRAALEGALEDAGWKVRGVELRVQILGGAPRPSTTIELEAPR
jgi:hypothetical protein